MTLFGPPDIARLKEKRKIKELIKALDYAKDNQVRIRAVNALSELKCNEAIPVLIDTLKDKNPVVSRSAADGLADLGYDGIVELIPLLDKNTDARVRQLSFRAI
jgi:HEAT repeat protein